MNPNELTLSHRSHRLPVRKPPKKLVNFGIDYWLQLEHLLINRTLLITKNFAQALSVGLRTQAWDLVVLACKHTGLALYGLVICQRDRGSGEKEGRVGLGRGGVGRGWRECEIRGT